MKAPVVDFSFLYDLSGSDSSYMHEVLSLYLDTVPAGVEKLEKCIKETTDHDAIQRQAHFLKSSASIVKVRGMYDDLVKLEVMAREHSDIEKLYAKLENLLENFNEALPLILAEKEKFKTAKN